MKSAKQIRAELEAIISNPTNEDMALRIHRYMDTLSGEDLKIASDYVDRWRSITGQFFDRNS
jgi:hypothetical protein